MVHKFKSIMHVKAVLDNIAEYVNGMENIFGELTEDQCENIQFQLAEIDSFIIGKQKLSASNIAMADIRVIYYWEYIEGKIEFDNLMKKLRENEGEI